MPGETALIDAAGGEFIPTLAAILVFAVLSGFFYMMRFIMDSNTKTNKLIVERLDKIFDKVSASQQEMANLFCEKLNEHDKQAKEILDDTKTIARELGSRPCINGRDK